MSEEFAGVRETIIQQIDEAALRRIEGWDGIESFAERVALHRVDLTSVEGTERKWSARGIVTIHLFNWDDEHFGELRLHLIASGHDDGSEVRIDDLVIAPNMH